MRFVNEIISKMRGPTSTEEPLGLREVVILLTVCVFSLIVGAYHPIGNQYSSKKQETQDMYVVPTDHIRREFAMFVEKYDAELSAANLEDDIQELMLAILREQEQK